MKKAVFSLLFPVFASTLLGQGAPPQMAADQPYAMEYYYKVQWGHQQEFLQLFLKNHYPLLQKIVESGRMLSVKIEQPANHMTEDGRWDYRVTIRFKNSTAATTANPDEERLIKQLWPDQEIYQARRAAPLRNSAGPLGPSGVRHHAEEIVTKKDKIAESSEIDVKCLRAISIPLAMVHDLLFFKLNGRGEL